MIDTNLEEVGDEILCDAEVLRAGLDSADCSAYLDGHPSPEPFEDATRRRMTGDARVEGSEGVSRGIAPRYRQA